MNQPDTSAAGRGALMVACLLGVASAATAGIAGLLAAAWHVLTLVVARRPIGPGVGVTALGLAALYALAALAGVSGTDPEDVDRHASLGLAAVAAGCVLVGVTSVLVWRAARRAALR
ncbi:MAG TPA: hypothetical protein VK601_23820 [Kofleriaceae bacterium]|nr:hypothetical protein [Kofleriaceae bacterium]